jgi:hypothetical protein
MQFERFDAGVRGPLKDSLSASWTHTSWALIPVAVETRLNIARTFDPSEAPASLFRQFIHVRVIDVPNVNLKFHLAGYDAAHIGLGIYLADRANSGFTVRSDEVVSRTFDVKDELPGCRERIVPFVHRRGPGMIGLTIDLHPACGDASDSRYNADWYTCLLEACVLFDVYFKPGVPIAGIDTLLAEEPDVGKRLPKGNSIVIGHPYGFLNGSLATHD